MQNFAVIVNQRARWCGNLLFNWGIPTPVCGLDRNDSIFLWSNILFDIPHEINAYGLTKGKCNDIMILIAEERNHLKIMKKEI